MVVNVVDYRKLAFIGLSRSMSYSWDDLRSSGLRVYILLYPRAYAP